VTHQRNKAVDYTILGICLFLCLFPLYWALVTALKPRYEFFRFPPTFWPEEITTKNFVDGWNWGGGKGILDSAIVALCSTGLAMFIGVFAAYSFSRWRTGGTHLPFFILTMRMIPPVVPAIAYYLIVRKHILPFPPFDSYLILICLYAVFNIPFVVWIMRGFVDEIPIQMEEAAQLMGVNRLRVFWEIVLPLSKPGLVAVALFSIFWSWNEFVFSLFLTSRQVNTLPKVIPMLLEEEEPMWGAINAVCLITIVPMVIIALLLQRYMARGLTYGAVSGST